MRQFPKVELNVFETILARRSVRDYIKQMVDAHQIRILLEAAVHAPTAMHGEPWAFVIIQDAQMLASLSERVKHMLAEQTAHTGYGADFINQSAFNIFYNANTLILICAKPGRYFDAADCWLAAENLMLAACSMGLGSCVIGSAVFALNLPEEKASLGISAEFEVVVPIIVGYPSGDTSASTRKRPHILSRFVAVGSAAIN